MSDDIRDDRQYTKDHEWAKPDGDTIVIGITAFAVEQLGDITMVNIDLAEGDKVEAGGAFGTVESVKTLSDLFAPIAGTITRINGELEDAPELINDDCWDKGWMVAITPADDDRSHLIDSAAYKTLVDESH